MSPNFRWQVTTPWTRARPPTDGGAPPSVVVRQALRRLADERRTGALHVLDGPGGVIHLVDGRVALVEVRSIPGADLLILRRGLDRPAWQRLVATTPAPGRDETNARARVLLRDGAIRPLEVDLILERAVTDAAGDLVGSLGSAATRTRFHAGATPWISLSDPPTVDELLVEVSRRDRLLGGLREGIRPDGPVRRRSRLPGTEARLSGLQWDLVALAEGRSPRDLAWRVGLGVFATTMEVSRLDALSLLEPVPRV